jgi:hypothetical protein
LHILAQQPYDTILQLPQHSSERLGPYSSIPQNCIEHPDHPVLLISETILPPQHNSELR